ncbi:MAG TPA: hypothetical protein VND65_01805 [Candidatus Binatia bacterium]|nr:hypothetical protein [Candidatus Binatia bacterium]
MKTLKLFRVIFNHGVNGEIVVVWARHHEEAYREALRAAGIEGRQPEARIQEQEEKHG